MMSRIPPMVAVIALLSGCAAISEHPDFEIYYVEAPTLCVSRVATYSDFAYVRPGDETVIGNDCQSTRDGFGDGPVAWVVAGEPVPPALKSEIIKAEQGFRRGDSRVKNGAAALSSLVQRAQDNPSKTIRIVGYAAKGEATGLADRRAKALKQWLIKQGLDESRMAIGPSGNGATKAEAEIIVNIKGS